MILIGKEGSPMTSNEYDQISPDPGSYNIGKLPYSPEVSKIREIICCAAGICNRWAYRIWRNMIYTVGYAETMIGEPHRHLATSELEQAGRYFWNLVFGTSRKDMRSIQSAMRETLTDYRLLVDLLHKSVPFGRTADNQSRTGDAEKKRTKPTPNDKDKSENAKKQK